MFPNIAKALTASKELKQLTIKTANHKLTLRLNNNKQFISLTDGQTTKSIYGKLTLTGQPLYKANTPQEIKDALLALNNETKLVSKVKSLPCIACQNCGKLLTDPKSIKLGYGPECATYNELEEE